MITIAEMKKQIEVHVRRAFSSPSTPHATCWNQDGNEVEILALAVSVPQALQAVAYQGCFAAALCIEARAPGHPDIIAIVLDHGDEGVVVGRAICDDEAEERIVRFEWHDGPLEPYANNGKLAFPRFSESGKIVSLRKRNSK